ncbi:8927_t:CDS:1, partial [Cetraspora pellucida]
ITSLGHHWDNSLASLVYEFEETKIYSATKLDQFESIKIISTSKEIVGVNDFIALINIIQNAMVV